MWVIFSFYLNDEEIGKKEGNNIKEKFRDGSFLIAHSSYTISSIFLTKIFNVTNY